MIHVHVAQVKNTNNVVEIKFDKAIPNSHTKEGDISG